MIKFTKEVLAKALSHDEYFELAKNIIDRAEKQKPYDNEAYLNYTISNIQRAEKIIRNFQLDKKLYNNLSDGIQDWTWVLLTEPWCGDSSFIEPVLYAMSIAAAGEIDFKILLRDENQEIMNQFLTNGGMAIPMLVCLDKELNVLGTFGPRPTALQEQFSEWQKDGMVAVLEDKIKLTYRWYHKDKNESIQKEFIRLVREWKKK